jgi:hypothetical protein
VITTGNGTGSVVAKYYAANASNLGFIKTGSIYAYTLDSNGNYKLSSTANGNDSFAATTTSYTNGAAKVYNTPANSNTVFVYAVSANGTTKYTTYTGIANAPTASSVTSNAQGIVVGSNGFAKLVYMNVTSGTVSGTTSSDLVYIPSASYLTQKTGSTTYYVYNAIINGVAGEVKSSANTLTKGTMYVVSATNADTGIKTLSGTITDMVGNGNEVGVEANSGSTLVTGSHTYTYTSSTVAYYIDAQGNSTQIAPDAIALDATDEVYVVNGGSSGDNTKATAIYVVEKDAIASDLTLIVTSTGGTVADGTSDSSNSSKDLVKGAVKVTSAAATQTAVVTPGGTHTGVSYVVSISGAGTTASSATANDPATYTLVAGDLTKGSINVTVTATDEYSGVQSVFTYTITLVAP